MLRPGDERWFPAGVRTVGYITISACLGSFRIRPAPKGQNGHRDAELTLLETPLALQVELYGPQLELERTAHSVLNTGLTV